MQWGRAAGPGGWVEPPGGVGAMAADAVAGETGTGGLRHSGTVGGLQARVPCCRWAVRGSGRCSRCCCSKRTGSVSLDRLAEDLWGGQPPEGWVTTVQIYVSHLRQALEPGRARGAAGEVLVTRNHGYLLRVDGERLDATLVPGRFCGGAGGARGGAVRGGRRDAARGRWACGAAGCWPTWPTTRSPGREAARLEELRLAAVEARIDAELALGRHDALTAELEQLVASPSAAGAAARPAHAGAVPLRQAGRRAGLPTGGSASCSPVSSASILGSRCGACTRVCSHRTRRWTGPVTAIPRAELTAALTPPSR